MSRTYFCGCFEHGSSKRISSVTTAWLGTTAVNAKDRMFGFELDYEDDSLHIYCYEVAGSPVTESLHLFEGVIERSDADSVEQLADLVRLAVSNCLKCVIDYTPVDADDNPIGDESTLSPENVVGAHPS